MRSLKKFIAASFPTHKNFRKYFKNVRKSRQNLWLGILEAESMMDHTGQQSRPLSRSILIVDDSPTIRKMIISALRAPEYEFYEAGTGLEAIELLVLRRFDAITLDLYMPDMHGIEFLQYMRHNRIFQKIPVLVISTRNDEAIQRTLEGFGVNRFLPKPFQPEKLVEAIQALFVSPGIQTEA